MFVLPRAANAAGAAMARAGHARKNPIPQTEHSMSGLGLRMKPTTRSGLWITLSASMALAFQSSVDALLPMAPGASVMVFFARPVLGLGVSALLLPLLERSPTSAGSITALGLAMSGALALVPQSFWSYHWAALAGAFVKVPLLCSLLLGDPAWAGWRLAGAFYGLLLGPMVATLHMPEETLRVLLALFAFSSAVFHFAVANGTLHAERKSDLRSLVLATLPASVALSGVVMAWLLLSVQLALLPLLHALHGHPLADRPLPLGLALLVSSFWLCHAPYPWMKSGPCLPLALCASSAIAALSMRGVAQAISGHDAWQLTGYRLLMQLSLGLLLVTTGTALGRLTSFLPSAFLGCALAAAAFLGEGVGLVLQLLMLPAFGALGTMKALALLPLCYAFLVVRHLPSPEAVDDFHDCDGAE
ncbi:unnamed protein product [Durusdinium trenchii]